MLAHRIQPSAILLLRLRLLSMVASRALIVARLLVVEGLLALLRRIPRELQRFPRP